MFGGGSITLFRVRGVPVRAHWTLFVIVPYLAFVFSAQFARVVEQAGLSPAALVLPPWAWGILLALGLFASVALHELAHTWVALRAGGRVREITLMLLGGVSQIERMPRRPGLEAVMAAAGPLASLVLGGLLFAADALPLTADGRFGLYYLARLNVVLAVFNLVPAFPLDGGRVLRAILALRIGPVRATRVAAAIGKGASILLVVAGVLGGNLLLLLVALFLYGGADYEARGSRLQALLQEVRLRDLMATPVPTVPSDATVADFVSAMQRAGRRELVVLDRGGQPVGLLDVADLVRMRRAELPGAEGERMPRERAEPEGIGLHGLARLGAHRLALAAPDELAGPALEKAAAGGVRHLLVVEPGVAGGVTLLGMVGPRELESALLLAAQPGARRPGGLRPRVI
jgi:Zn-dependent protease